MSSTMPSSGIFEDIMRLNFLICSILMTSIMLREAFGWAKRPSRRAELYRINATVNVGPISWNLERVVMGLVIMVTCTMQNG